MKYHSFFIAFNFFDTSKGISILLTNANMFCHLQKMSLVLANFNDLGMYTTFCFISSSGGNVFLNAIFDLNCKSKWKSPGAKHVAPP